MTNRLALRALLPLGLFVLGVATAGARPDEKFEEPLAYFKKCYASKEESKRLAAVAELGSNKGRPIIEALLGPLRKDDSQEVRRAAAKELGEQYASAVAAAALAKGLEPDADGGYDVALAVIAALGETQSDAAVPTLVALLKPKSQWLMRRPGRAKDDPETSITGAAIDALGHTGSAKAVPSLIELLNAETPVYGDDRLREAVSAIDPLRIKAEAALTRITGEHYKGATAWTGWWTESHSRLKTVPVHRDEKTGKIFDKPTPAKSPAEGGGVFLRTRFESVPIDAEPAVDSKESREERRKRLKRPGK